MNNKFTITATGNNISIEASCDTQYIALALASLARKDRRLNAALHYALFIIANGDGDPSLSAKLIAKANVILDE